MLSVIVLAFQAAIWHFSSASFCPEIKPMKNGNFETEDIPPYKDRAEIVFKCDRGYKGYGKMNITCRNGRWSDPVPYCAATRRPKPRGACIPLTRDLVVDITCTNGSNQYSTCTTTCRKGFMAVEGSSRRVCRNGRWLGVDIKCKATRRPKSRGACIPLTRDLGIDITCTNGSNQYSTCTTTCLEGFTAVEGSSRRVCRNGRWLGVDIKCKPTRRPGPRRTCTPLTRDLGVEITCTKGSNHFSNCYVTCKEGFTAVEGSSTIGRKLCMYGRWIGDDIICKDSLSCASWASSSVERSEIQQSLAELATSKTSQSIHNYPALSIPIEVGNDKDKWQSSNLKEGDTVTLIPYSNETQTWLLEATKEGSDAMFWSFFVMSGKRKLYLTYNDDDAKDQNVTMNFVSDSDGDGKNKKERYFKAYEGADGNSLFESRSFRDRYLGFKNNTLIMVDATEFTVEMEWILVNSFELALLRTEYIVEIQQYKTPTDYWKSSDSEMFERISVGSSSDSQLWHIFYSSRTTCQIRAMRGKYLGYFASQDDNEVTFGNATIPSTSRSWTKERGKSKSPDQMYLQSVKSKMYVGKQNPKTSTRSFLEMKEDITHATHWLFRTMHYIIHTNKSSIIYPPLPNAVIPAPDPDLNGTKKVLLDC